MPSVSYLEAMEAARYQQATQDDALREAWAADRDPLARAFLLVAAVHRDAATGSTSGAVTNADDALTVLREDVDESWTRTALIQHVDQCLEYLDLGKPLPDLPSGL